MLSSLSQVSSKHLKIATAHGSPLTEAACSFTSMGADAVRLMELEPPPSK